MMKGWERRVRVPGLQEGGFAGDVGWVPSPGGGGDRAIMRIAAGEGVWFTKLTRLTGG